MQAHTENSFSFLNFLRLFLHFALNFLYLCDPFAFWQHRQQNTNFKTKFMATIKRQSRSKAEIAEALGVSASTLKNWLRSRQETLEAMGVSHYAKVLPPKAVDFICSELGLVLDE